MHKFGTISEPHTQHCEKTVTLRVLNSQFSSQVLYFKLKALARNSNCVGTDGLIDSKYAKIPPLNLFSRLYLTLSTALLFLRLHFRQYHATFSLCWDIVSLYGSAVERIDVQSN